MILNGFKFSLQKLLDIRKDKEEESKRIFKEAQVEKEKVEQKLNSLYENYNKYKQASTNENLTSQKIRHIYLNALNSNILETKVELQNKTKKLEEKRIDLKQKQIDRKTVETLKDKKLKEFIREQNQLEQKTNDEFALYGFIRNLERRWKSEISKYQYFRFSSQDGF